ncbi:hypothetical protein [Sphingopyxis sp. C-1]|uniref:hypothetical protein n=1 Tax=Sphingopyxis sp. C-1 TaxID=262667 RepID=UPI00187BE640|nr:hypothetical protein [Sphingopyxis sp. C-1]
MNDFDPKQVRSAARANARIVAVELKTAVPRPHRFATDLVLRRGDRSREEQRKPGRDRSDGPRAAALPGHRIK